MSAEKPILQINKLPKHEQEPYMKFAFTDDGRPRIRVYSVEAWGERVPQCESLLALSTKHLPEETPDGWIEVYLPPDTPQAQARLEALYEQELALRERTRRLLQSSEYWFRAPGPRS